ncbi:MAG: hydroxyisourate hydrolase [Candidatus Sericytochromatia bacterium]|nr:hydroxyisourate hydrolase [Candidatus Sericytochromatia bacterium]
MKTACTLSTHVLDTTSGRPAAGIPVSLDRLGEAGPVSICCHSTDADGRVRAFGTEGARFDSGTYRLRFDTAEHFRSQGTTGFYPYVEIVFFMEDTGGHYHVPLLLSPYGYTTYRGS